MLTLSRLVRFMTQRCQKLASDLKYTHARTSCRRGGLTFVYHLFCQLYEFYPCARDSLINYVLLGFKHFFHNERG